MTLPLIPSAARPAWIVRWRIGSRTFISPTDENPQRVESLIQLILAMPAVEDLLVLTRQPDGTEWKEGLWRGQTSYPMTRDFGRRLADAEKASHL